MSCRAPIRIVLSSLILAMAVAVPLTMPSQAASRKPMPNSATLTVLHVAPSDGQVATVDVYADEMRIMNDLTPGQLRGVRITAGTYNIRVFVGGGAVDMGAPLIELSQVNLTNDSNNTIAIHPDEAGATKATMFSNTTLRNQKGSGRLVIRHLASGSDVDAYANGSVMIGDLANQDEATLLVSPGAYRIAVMSAGTDQVLLDPRTVAVTRPMTTVVYVWGSTDGTLRLALQRIQVGRPKP